MRKLLIVILLSLILTSCGILKAGNTASVPHTEGNMQPLHNPPGNKISVNMLYPIPERHYEPVKSVDITPPGLVASPKPRKIKNVNTVERYRSGHNGADSKSDGE